MWEVTSVQQHSYALAAVEHVATKGSANNAAVAVVVTVVKICFITFLSVLIASTDC